VRPAGVDRTFGDERKHARPADAVAASAALLEQELTLRGMAYDEFMKTLAEETRRATEQIDEQIQAVQAGADDSTEVLEAVLNI
jgi:hypothetical protein